MNPSKRVCFCFIFFTTRSFSVIEVSKKTGDYASLSLVDIKVIALTLDLHIENCGVESVVFDVKPQPPIWEDVNELRKKKVEHLQKASAADTNEVAKDLESLKLDNEDPKHANDELTGKHIEDEIDAEGNSEVADESDDGRSEEGIENALESDSEKKHQSIGGHVRSGFGEWIDESNLQEVIGRMEAPTMPAHLKMKVACLSTDFALQNVLLHMKLNICSIDGMKISRLRTYILRCR